eukprot:COSAG01_NODE_16292_length_1250_cov_1.195482_1_plen_81_part_10
MAALRHCCHCCCCCCVRVRARPQPTTTDLHYRKVKVSPALHCETVSDHFRTKPHQQPAYNFVLVRATSIARTCEISCKPDA